MRNLFFLYWFRALAALALLLILASCARSPEEKSKAWVKSAQGYVEKKDYAAAIIEFQNAIAAMPKNADLHYQLGLALLRTGSAARAIASFKTSADLDPSHVDSRVKLADILSHNSDQKMLSIAESYAQAALALRADDPEILNILATVEWRQNKTDAAKAHLKQALQKDPGHPKSASNLALMQWTVDHDEAGAEKTFRGAVERSHGSPDALVALGRFYSAVGRPGAAEAQFQKALESEPNHGVALMELSKLQQSSGRMTDAEQTERRLSALPDKAYRSSHALFLFQTGKRDAAIQELKEYMEKDPANGDVRSKLVGFYVDTNKLDDAARVIAEALARDAHDADALEQQARLQLARLQFEEARKSAAEAIRLRPESAFAHYLLAKAFKGLGFPNGKGLAEYRSELKLSVEKDPQLVQARLDLSESLRTGKSFTEALDLLDRVPALQRDLPQVLVERVWVLLAMNRRVEARDIAGKLLARERTPAALLQSGLLELEDKKAVAARNLLEESLKAVPDSVEALSGVAESFAMENRPAAAVERLRQQAARAPNSAPVRFLLASWLERTGEVASARPVYAAALSLNPEYAPAAIATARMEMLQGQWPRARGRVEAVLARDFSNADALLALAMIEDGTGQREAAIKAYRKVLQVQPANIPALNNLVASLCENPSTAEEAVQLARQLKGAAPNSLVVDDTVGWAYYKQGQYALAVTHLEKAASVKLAQPKYHLAMAYFRAGRRELGHKTLSAALQLDPNLPEANLARAVAAE